ncbi:VOC family protein [Teredinibacter turnerae]|uniref:VOC family protein n=1 Tax=Teredinibacter turnerae TaxID=2426 RepID=UPI0030D0F753
MKLSTYLLFDGSCKPAMEYYASVLGGELNIYLVGESPMKDMFPESMHHLVVNSTIVSDSFKLSASDFLRTSEEFVQGNNLSLYIDSGSAEDIKKIYKRLTEDAQITDPLAEHPFGLFGALQDKFGVCWKFHAVLD